MDDEDYRLLTRIERDESLFRPAGESAEDRSTRAELEEPRDELLECPACPMGGSAKSQDASYMAVDGSRSMRPHA